MKCLLSFLLLMSSVIARAESFVPSVQVQLSTSAVYVALSPGMTLEEAIVILDAGAEAVANQGISGGTLVTNLNVTNLTIRLDAGISVDGDASGTSARMTVDVNAAGAGAPLFIAADGHLETTDADSTATMPCFGLALESGTGVKEILLNGFVVNTDWSWTIGGNVYASTSVGELTQTRPTGTGDQVQIVGVATGTNTLYFSPSYVIVELE